MIPNTAEPVRESSLLGPDEPPACELFNPDGDAPVLLVCDHASNRVPAALEKLGLAEEDLQRHIGWDIGAAEATREMARRLNAPAILHNYSRLVIDCNRQPGDPTSIPAISDGTIVPRNQDLTIDDMQRRIAALFNPYHDMITQVLARLWLHNPAPAIVAMHSFTPCLKAEGGERPWHVGILWNRDKRMAAPMIDYLRRKQPDLCIGDNEPYSGKETGYSCEFHASAAGLPHVAIELRQDMIGDDAGARRFGALMVDALRPVLADPELHKVRVY